MTDAAADSPATGDTAVIAASADPTPQLSALLQAEPDLVDRIFDFIVAEHPELRGRATKIKAALRAEFAGEQLYVSARPPAARQELAARVLAIFNGRNATTIARRLNISRATVYRILKQPGAVASAPQENCLSFPGNETAQTVR